MKGVERILHNPGLLLGQPFDPYRKAPGRLLVAAHAPDTSLKVI